MLILPILCFLCYMPGGGKNIIFLMPGIMVAQMSLGVHSSLLISGGRRQRFWSALALALITSVLVTVVVAMIAGGTHLLESIMPQVTFKGHEYAFKALNMNFAIVPLLMIPLTLIIGLIFYKKPVLTILLAIILFQIFFALGIIGDLTIMNVPLRIGLSHMTILLIFNWAIFVAVLRHISMRSCLVSQSK